MFRRFRLALAVALLAMPTLSAQSPTPPADGTGHAAGGHAAGHDHAAAVVKPPKIFLDKSPKIIEYQLKRLSNAELLLAERSPENPKTIPVYAAILVRSGIPSGERRAAAVALAQLKSTSVIEELLVALNTLPADDAAETARSAKDLTAALLAEPRQELGARSDLLRKDLDATSPWARRAAAAGLLLAGKVDLVSGHAAQSAESAVDMLVAVSWLDAPEARAALRPLVLPWLEAKEPLAVRRQAIRTLGSIPDQASDTFQRLAQLVQEEPLREDAVRALASVPPAARDRQLAARLAERLIADAEATPIADRSSDRFVDAIGLAESLLPALPEEVSRAYRQRLRGVAVRTVRIRTVEEEMRYDVKFFAVEAGRPVEVILKNEDLMPHNLVITAPGALKEVAFAAAKMAPDEVNDGKQYVPQSDKVLHATSMVPAGKQERLAFSAPTTAGEYPFVCTFPNHWMRMYGVMVVVEDLDAWEKQPTVPADPIGNNRSFVRKWSLADLASELETGLRGRSREIGERLFKEASCQQCHKVGGQGGVVGPDLSDVATRWKGDSRGILQEVLEPSHKIDAKYAVQSVLTADGKVYSGIIVAEDKNGLALISSPEQTEPTRIARDDVEEIVKSSKSIMPIGLLDQYTKDEIFEILSYLITPAPGG
ncbi:MAG: plastocyanin/azurin family copper-binding protein [Aureliella sp.]